jgi:phage shock protein C
VSRSDRIQEDLARAARRAKRLAERAKQRAERKAKRATEVAYRAEELAKRAARKSRRRDRDGDLERSIEDLVDDVTEKWTHKAEDWVEQTKDRLTGEDDQNGDSYSDSAGVDDEDLEGASIREERTRSRRHRTRPARRHRKRSARARVRSFRHRLRNGRSLYRDPEAGKVCGVCAGFAQYYGIENWQVRLGAILGLIFIPSLTFTGYFIAYFLMDKKPYYQRISEPYEEEDSYRKVNESEELEVVNETKRARGRRGRKKTAHQESRASNAQSVKIAKGKFMDLENRLRSMESHVTDSKFELQRELRKISGES